MTDDAADERGRPAAGDDALPGSAAPPAVDLRTFQHAVEQSLSIVVLTDANGRIQYVNPKFTEVTGYAPEETIGRYIEELGALPPDEQMRLWETVRDGGHWQGEIENRTRGGESYWVFTSVSPVRSDAGVTTHFLGLGVDITERKRAEEALRDSEAKFRALAEMSSAIISIIQGEKLVYVNPAAQAIGGYTQEELLARPFWQTLHPDWQEETRQRALARQRGEDVATRAEVKIITKSGEERWLDLTAGVIEYGGQPAVLATAFDITDRKRAEEALRHSEERYRILYRENPSMYFTVDAQGTVLSVNQFGAEQLAIRRTSW